MKERFLIFKSGEILCFQLLHELPNSRPPFFTGEFENITGINLAPFKCSQYNAYEFV